MYWQPPPRPRWVDRLNGHADHAGHARLLVPLEPDELLAAATERAGLDDFGRPGEFGDGGSGGAGWQTHFETFMEALEHQGNLHLTGRLLTRTDLLAALRNRLELVDLWRHRPHIGEQPVDGPLVVIGAARSGTSILHELLALDPAHNTPTTWKVHRPVAAATGDAATVGRRTTACRLSGVVLARRAARVRDHAPQRRRPPHRVHLLDRAHIPVGQLGRHTHRAQLQPPSGRGRPPSRLRVAPPHAADAEPARAGPALGAQGAEPSGHPAGAVRGLPRRQGHTSPPGPGPHLAVDAEPHGHAAVDAHRHGRHGTVRGADRGGRGPSAAQGHRRPGLGPPARRPVLRPALRGAARRPGRRRRRGLRALRSGPPIRAARRRQGLPGVQAEGLQGQPPILAQGPSA